MGYVISRGASINQYKASRCVNFTPIVELLDSRVMDYVISRGASINPYKASSYLKAADVDLVSCSLQM
ncbi:hypothetical protein H5410_006551 [Solanum commersonii]|uniref:Uncharacterized protein n=1 Tax=Solanum commersonii TaxID=4109 RepID=A0A9J6A9N9_SOLCO|nr:hypothetical protein H5410_006551 [Solanum commersonii]